MPADHQTIVHARVMAALTFLSRLLGLIREQLLCYYFGTAELLSAFRIAFMVPNLTRRLFGEGALSAALIPVLTDHLHTHGEPSARRLVGAVLAHLIPALLVAVALAEALVAAWRAYRDDFALELTAILLPYMVFICIAAVVSGVLNVRNRFAVPAALPIVLNVLIIGSILCGVGWLGLTGRALMAVVCAGILLAGALQLLWIGVSLRRASFWPRFDSVRGHPALRKIGLLMTPMIVGLSAMQINALADHVIAYLFVRHEGARVGPAVLGCAHFLYQLPLGVFGIALATAIFPVLSRKAAEGDRQGVARVFSEGLRMSLFIGLPASVGLMFVARPLVATLYEHGAFGATSTDRVSATLLCYSAGLAAYFAQHIVVRTFYALGDSRTPARVALSMVGVNLTMNLALVFWLRGDGSCVGDGGLCGGSGCLSAPKTAFRYAGNRLACASRRRRAHAGGDGRYGGWAHGDLVRHA